MTDEVEDLVKQLEASIQLLESALTGIRKVQLTLAGHIIRQEQNLKKQENKTLQ